MPCQNPIHLRSLCIRSTFLSDVAWVGLVLDWDLEAPKRNTSTWPHYLPRHLFMCSMNTNMCSQEWLSLWVGTVRNQAVFCCSLHFASYCHASMCYACILLLQQWDRNWCRPMYSLPRRWPTFIPMEGNSQHTCQATSNQHLWFSTVEEWLRTMEPQNTRTQAGRGTTTYKMKSLEACNSAEKH